MTDIQQRILQAERDGARAKAIEECAQVAENFYSDNPYPTTQGAIARAIRELAEKRS